MGLVVVLVVAVVFFLDMVIPSFFSLVLVVVLVVALMLVVVFFLDIVIPLSSVELSVSAHASSVYGLLP